MLSSAFPTSGATTDGSHISQSWTTNKAGKPSREHPPPVPIGNALTSHGKGLGFKSHLGVNLCVACL